MSHNQPTGKRDRSDRSAARQGLRARQSPGGKRQSPGGKRQSPRDVTAQIRGRAVSRRASGRLVRGGQTRPALITARVHPGMVHQSQKSRNPINPDKSLQQHTTPKRTPQFAVGPPMPKSSAVIRVQAQSVNHVGALHRCRSGQKGTWRALAGVMMYPYACS
ncbi:hypothetical protein J6590_096550 [Homalodisca vitripennis]|nr:hypothetical protein J6590_096550 [Homalodisca vitripennis]